MGGGWMEASLSSCVSTCAGSIGVGAAPSGVEVVVVVCVSDCERFSVTSTAEAADAASGVGGRDACISSEGGGGGGVRSRRVYPWQNGQRGTQKSSTCDGVTATIDARTGSGNDGRASGAGGAASDVSAA